MQKNNKISFLSIIGFFEILIVNIRENLYLFYLNVSVKKWTLIKSIKWDQLKMF